MRIGFRKLTAIIYALAAFAGVAGTTEAHEVSSAAIHDLEFSPLYLEHSSSFFLNGGDNNKSFQSDCDRRKGHYSHRSHHSHRSHRSHYSGR
jgi:hypothetical protein